MKFITPKTAPPLKKAQEHTIPDILHALDHGAIHGTGTAKGALLGDIMGSGKTVSAICAVNMRLRFKRILVLCMTGAIETVWVKHIRLWQTRDLLITPVAAANLYDIGAIESGWVIVPYSMLKKHHDDLRAKEWDLIIIDEGQMLKTWNAQRTMHVFGGNTGNNPKLKRVKGTPRNRHITPLATTKTKILVLTGTPIKNAIAELQPLAHFLDPVSFPSLEKLVKEAYEPDYMIDNNRRVSGRAKEDLSALSKKLRNSILIRRPPEELASALTKISYRLAFIRQTDGEEGPDDISLIDTATPVETIAVPADNDFDDDEEEAVAPAEPRVWAPYDVVSINFTTGLGLQAWFAAKETRIAELHAWIASCKDPVQKEIYEEQLKIVMEETRYRTGQVKRGLVRSYLLQLPADKKTIVFGWHRDVLETLAEELREAGRRVVTYLGGTDEPDKVVAQFQTDKSIQFFIGNLECASTSITLHAANHVVLAEQAWAPSDEDQAIARAWRIGQKRDVSVVKFFLSGSFDDRLWNIQSKKRDVVERVLDGKNGGKKHPDPDPPKARPKKKISPYESEPRFEVGAKVFDSLSEKVCTILEREKMSKKEAAISEDKNPWHYRLDTPDPEEEGYWRFENELEPAPNEPFLDGQRPAMAYTLPEQKKWETFQKIVLMMKSPVQAYTAYQKAIKFCSSNKLAWKNCPRPVVSIITKHFPGGTFALTLPDGTVQTKRLADFGR